MDYLPGDTVTRTGYLPLHPVWQPVGAVAPSGLTATSVTSASSSFSWTNPTNGSFAGSQLAWRTGSSGAWTLVGASSNSAAGSISLPAGSTVQVQVVSYFSPSGSLSSTPITVSVPNAPAPSSPTASPSPSPTDSTPATTSPAPTPGGTVMPTGPLAPNLPGSNSAIPVTGVPLGDSVLLVNGQPQSLTVKPTQLESNTSGSAKKPTALVIEGDGFSMTIAGLGTSGKPLGLTPDGALILEADRRAAVEGTGFQPNSDVELFLFSDPRYVGKVHTDAVGSFKDTVPLPADIPAGRHTLQSNGFDLDGQVRSVSLGVQLNPVSTSSKTRISSRTVYFRSLSSVLTPKAKSKLRALVKKTGHTAQKANVLGFVQRGGTNANNSYLSHERAKVVAQFLRNLGLKAAYTVRGKGVFSASGRDARKAVINVRYVKP